MIPTLRAFLKENIYLLVITLLAFAGALSRLVPHPMNFSPITALALLGAFYFKKAWQSFLIPLVALLLSDLFIGFYPYIWSVYGAYFFITFAARFMPEEKSLGTKLFCLLPSSLFFFFVTNSAYFFQGGAYSKDLQGYISCLVAGLPFLKNALAGDLFYGILILGGAELIRRKLIYAPRAVCAVRL